MRPIRPSRLRMMLVALLGLAACSGGGETDAPTSTLGVPACNTTGTVDDPNVLNGVYQLDWTYEDLAEATGLTGEIVEGNVGLYTLVFSDGCFNQSGPCAGSYTVTGDRVSMVATLRRADWVCGGVPLGAEFVDAAWVVTEDQLTLSDFVPVERLEDTTNIIISALLGTKPLLRVEGAD